jgi:peptidoglycan/LPS O-acetylase OafA/YrhL
MFGVTNPDILPPAWSLGLEAFFYLVIPFLLIYKARGSFYIASMVIFYLACLGFINTDFYGYRLLPGVLFIFLCGSYLWWPSRRDFMVLLATWVISFLTLIAILAGIIPQAPFNTEVTTGIVIGIPAVRYLSAYRFQKVDEFLGNISYGVFLNHFVVIYAASALGYKELTPFTIVLILNVSLSMSTFTYYLIERPAIAMRHALRSNKSKNNPAVTDSRN